MHTYIIAEAGVNHNGSLELAKQLIDAGAEAGVDSVKFQTFDPSALTTSSAGMADYQKTNTGRDTSQLEMLSKLTLSKEDHLALLEYAGKRSVAFSSSPFDLDSVDFLNELNLPFWKIPSGEITNLPYLKKIAAYNEEVILSTGMCYLSDVDRAIGVLTENGTDRDKITLLHCNTDYPTRCSDVNLRCMNTLREAFQLKVGYSDHTEGIEIPVAAVALGACVIEKHITLDKKMEGPDHRASLNPVELKEMVRCIRNVEAGMGSALKRPTLSESKNRNIARKSLVAACDIARGTIFAEEHLTSKRPGSGISPMDENLVIGLPAARDFKKDEIIEFC